ncbi:MAG: MoxR family ATPase [Acidimicrobiia bacterium]|nr:MoxR family ATPase [Acidimicrobiia bacterium]MDH5236450.1 MoxR family ATPase [Acidimicrobiia bacterium]
MTTAERTRASQAEVEHFAERLDRLVDNIERIIKGKTDVVQLALVGMLAEGHLLIEDVPGVGKTTLARAMAESIDGTLSRIQFTPDLLPTDVTGVQIFSNASNKFEFHPGSVFANIVLGDEINRASPKTQSALLEVMEEHQVTVDGVPHPVPDPFVVIATQNPVELDGTYNLPEAQLDRFMMRLRIGYPNQAAEMEIIDALNTRHFRPELSALITPDEFRRMSDIGDRIHVAPNVRHYIVSIARETRNIPQLRLGASPRGSASLARAARAFAAAAGRTYVMPEDIKTLAPHVLTHRLILTPEAELQGVSAAGLLERVLAEVPVPAERDSG